MSDSEPNLSEFYLSAANAARLIEKHIEEGSIIRVISHIDADGIAAASIIGKALRRNDAEFRISNVKQIDGILIDELKSEGSSPIIFCDMGSGNLELLKVAFDGINVIVLDHHQPVGEGFSTLHQVNPHLNGFDGAREICAAGVSYLTAKALDGSNIDLSAMAVVGSLGDSQDRFDKRSLGGLNKGIVKDAIDSGCVRAEENELMLYGRETRPVHKALAYTTNPYIPGLSGEEDKCLAFVTNIGLDIKKGDRWIAVNDLSTEQKQTLFSELAKYMVSKKLGTAIMNLVGTVYTLVYEDRGKPLRDGREYSTLLNACGRMNKTGLGVAIGLGNRDIALTEALEAFAKYKKTLSDYMEWISANPRIIETHENIFIVNGTGVIDELMLSTISSIITSSGLTSEPKPIVAMTDAKGGRIKVSGRLPEELKGKVNLGLIFHEATERIGGVGGGHDVAAGAEFSKENMVEFVKIVNDSVGRVLSNQKANT